MRADLDIAGFARQAEAELVQRVLGQRHAGHQQHAAFGQIADAAGDFLGHHIADQHGLVDFPPRRAPVLFRTHRESPLEDAAEPVPDASGMVSSCGAAGPEGTAISPSSS